jgi:hypothetical protein
MISKIMMFAMSIASRGKDNNKINDDVKKLRYISCFGIGNPKPCSNLKKSDKSNFYYCGGCGCGDHSHTWLLREQGTYSKLDYPYLNCPLKMPGFSNYDPNSPEQDLHRKKQIENLPPEIVQRVNLTVSVNKQKQDMFDAVNKIIENS